MALEPENPFHFASGDVDAGGLVVSLGILVQYGLGAEYKFGLLGEVQPIPSAS